MGAIYGFLRALNALGCRLAGLAGAFVSLGAYRLKDGNPDALAAAFGTADQAGYALIALPALSAVFLVPPLTRILFEGGPDWRMARGVLQLVALAALVVLSALTLQAVLGTEYPAREPVLTIIAQVLLGVMAVTWLGRETGLSRGVVARDVDRAAVAATVRDLRRTRSRYR